MQNIIIQMEIKIKFFYLLMNTHKILIFFHVGKIILQKTANRKCHQPDVWSFSLSRSGYICVNTGSQLSMLGKKQSTWEKNSQLKYGNYRGHSKLMKAVFIKCSFLCS